MDIRLINQAVRDLACDTLIVGAARAGKGSEGKRTILSPAAGEVDQVLDGLLTSIYENGEFKGNLGEITQIYTLGKMAARRVLMVGLGNEDQIHSHTFRRASGIAVRHAQSKGASQVALALEMADDRVDPAEALQAMVEGALLGVYSFSKYQTMRTNGHSIEQIQFVNKNATSQTLQAALSRGQVMAEAANFTRDLVNEQPAILTPGELANRAYTMAQQFGLECEILDRPQMEELGMGGLLAVARGSAEPPKFIILHYRGAPQSTSKTLALVGKGITFDSGGLSLKTGEGMVTMKGDMGGAAAVIGAMQIIAALKPAINVTALVSSSENMPDGAAFRPGDVLRLMNGKTIEIVNTDAEGRLVLADALSYAVKEGYEPIIDIATLTGACAVALGGKRAGLFCNDNQLRDELMAAGEITGEKFWPMPIDEDYQENIESHIADIKQTGGRLGGAINAAKILEHFVGTAQWAHLDMASMVFVDGKSAFMGHGASGFGARALATLALQRAEKQRT
ncbi:MAG TPA: leucyl aminopeptidase [Ktedonobacteraceae bacterium]|nr:leucyl aminopeptidase [Ktedonobacteraceae bacterium]